jgi:D-tyrosyl-tRNA(Tyr) deacylase
MKCVIQRVHRARVDSEGQCVGEIDRGLLVLACLVRGDTERDMIWTAKKLLSLRVFPGEGRDFDRDVQQIGGGLLVVSNFTIAAATAKGRRPSFDPAMPPIEARPAFDRFLAILQQQIHASPADAPRVRNLVTGRFGCDMNVSLDNDGPVTLLLDSSQNPA